MYPELLKYQNVENMSDLQIINLGTGMGYYDFCYDDITISAFNFSLPQQVLQFDYKILKNYYYLCKKDCRVCIVLPYFIFCANHFSELDDIYERYYSILPVEEVEGYCKNSYEIYSKKINADGIYGRLELKKPLSKNELEIQSQDAIRNWEQKLPIISCASGELHFEAIAQMAESKNWLKKILELCYSKQFTPIIIIPPMSTLLLKRISRGFRMSYFYDQLYDVIDDTIMVLDYTENDTYCNSDIYGWPGFLIKDAAKEFTKDVLAKIGLL